MAGVVGPGWARARTITRLDPAGTYGSGSRADLGLRARATRRAVAIGYWSRSARATRSPRPGTVRRTGLSTAASRSTKSATGDRNTR